MHNTPLAAVDCVGPIAAAIAFVAVMSQVREPMRRTVNAIILAGASGVYLSGGFGPWELIYPVIGLTVACRGLRSYRAIGFGWLIHAGWDIVHHFYGNPIWPFMPGSAFGCMVFDTMIAPWFLLGAPSFLRRPLGTSPAAERRTIHVRESFRQARGIADRATAVDVDEL